MDAAWADVRAVQVAALAVLVVDLCPSHAGWPVVLAAADHVSFTLVTLGQQPTLVSNLDAAS